MSNDPPTAADSHPEYALPRRRGITDCAPKGSLQQPHVCPSRAADAPSSCGCRGAVRRLLPTAEAAPGPAAEVRCDRTTR